MRPGASSLIIGLLASGWVLIPAATTWGQSPDPASTAVFQTGPLAFTPAISIPELGLDSNVFNQSETPRQDFMANVQPEIDAWLRFGPLRLGGREQLNLIYFRRYESQRAVNSNGNLRAELLLFWATPHASVSFVRTNARTDIRIDTRAVTHSRPATVGIDFRLSSSTSIDLGADFNTISYEEGATFGGTSLRNALDRDTRSYFAALRYAATPVTSTTLRVSRTEDRFRFSPQRDAEGVRVVPGIAFATDAVITGSAEVGWLRLNTGGPARRPYTGAVATVRLGYVLLGLTRFQLTVDRDVVPSIDTIANYALQTGLTGTVTHRVTERWDVNARASRVKLDFGQVRSLLDQDTEVNRADVVKSYGGGIGFYFNRGLRVGVRIEAISRSSVLPSGRYDNLRLMSSISYTLQ